MELRQTFDSSCSLDAAGRPCSPGPLSGPDAGGGAPAAQQLPSSFPAPARQLPGGPGLGIDPDAVVSNSALFATASTIDSPVATSGGGTLAGEPLPAPAAATAGTFPLQPLLARGREGGGGGADLEGGRGAARGALEVEQSGRYGGGAGGGAGGGLLSRLGALAGRRRLGDRGCPDGGAAADAAAAPGSKAGAGANADADAADGDEAEDADSFGAFDADGPDAGWRGAPGGRHARWLSSLLPQSEGGGGGRRLHPRAPRGRRSAGGAGAPPALGAGPAAQRQPRRRSSLSYSVMVIDMGVHELSNLSVPMNLVQVGPGGEGVRGCRGLMGLEGP
jgi:hypothetical protein